MHLGENFWISLLRDKPCACESVNLKNISNREDDTNLVEADLFGSPDGVSVPIS